MIRLYRKSPVHFVEYRESALVITFLVLVPIAIPYN
jgi:hypothetical protein